jgi:hypothetical protein
MMLAAMSGIDRTRRIAQRIHLPVSRRDLLRLTEQRAVQRLEQPARFVEGEVGVEAGNRLELVERSTGMSQPSARHHRHGDAERRDQRREDDRHLVSDAARRVLVDARAIEVSQLQRITAAEHRVGEGVGLAAIETAEKARHEERRHLVVGNMPRCVGVCEGTPLAGLDVSTITFALDES